MLQLKNITKQYKTGTLVQSALSDVTLNLRDNEFVAVLGPSGSGKTTLLNVIGGLDQYDSGDLIINGISTKKYKDRDWDSYRNHTIGFVFQSYNLIPHQSVLANVELALTISGISRRERKKRAKQALERVGLGDQLHKKPNQMSGGQMQRVAIARALVNDPDILLADEPTGALDTETSVQVMELLKEVASDRLVIMVTHNPELAETYATRIVKLRDGAITDDSQPFEPDPETIKPAKHKNMGKSSMSYFTSLLLSFNNLRTKKARTILTAFAGSIGIIGIALISSLSTGVQNYIDDIQRETMTSYPITINEQTVDLSSLMGGSQVGAARNELTHELDGVYSNALAIQAASTLTSSITENNLTEFKKYLDNPDSQIHEYLSDNGIAYSYDVQFSVYTHDPEGTLVNADSSIMSAVVTDDNMYSQMNEMSQLNPMMSAFTSGSFQQMLSGNDGQLVSPVITDSYELLYGQWPQSKEDVVLILDRNNEINLTTLYSLGYLPASEYNQILSDISLGNEVEAESYSWSYEDMCDHSFYLIPACDFYSENPSGYFTYLGDSTSSIEDMLDDAIELNISGVIRPVSDDRNSNISGSVGYTAALTDYLINYTAESKVVKAQQENPNINVVSGLAFAPDSDEEKIKDAAEYLAALNLSEKAAVWKSLASYIYSADQEMLMMLSTMSETELAGMLDAFLLQPDDQLLLTIYDSYVTPGTYDDNMDAFGFVSLEAPSSISLYSDSFEDKDFIADCIKAYNTLVSEEDQITYTDYVGLLMSSITTIINVISYVLIAFVAVSLVVSSIMIGIITYISVLERTKEIGVLRAIGASKRNISQVFNAETFIIGLFSGGMGVGISLLLLIPANAVIHHFANSTDLNAVLTFPTAAILVVLSVILTLIGGLIPSKKAAKKDPVAALRTE